MDDEKGEDRDYPIDYGDCGVAHRYASQLACHKSYGKLKGLQFT